MIIVYIFIAFIILVVLSDEISERGFVGAVINVFGTILFMGLIIYLLCGLVALW